MEAAMTPGSDEWFREEAEKAAGPESPLWAPVFEKALRRVWDAACEECANGCDYESLICAKRIRAKQVKPLTEPTPRTDRAVQLTTWEGTSVYELVRADFARNLERELAQAEAARVKQQSLAEATQVEFEKMAQLAAHRGH